MNIGSGALKHAGWSLFGDRFVCVIVCACACGGDQSLFDNFEEDAGPLCR